MLGPDYWESCNPLSKKKVVIRTVVPSAWFHILFRSKIFLKTTLARLQPQAENILSEEQAGSRKGRSCVDQIFILLLIYAKLVAGFKIYTEQFIQECVYSHIIGYISIFCLYKGRELNFDVLYLIRISYLIINIYVHFIFLVDIFSF